MTVESVKRAIYIWGFYPALYTLREQQDLENYENCKVIKQALDSIGKGREWYLSSSVEDDSMNEVYDNILDGFKNPSLINSNMPYYIDGFKKEVKC